MNVEMNSEQRIIRILNVAKANLFRRKPNDFGTRSLLYLLLQIIEYYVERTFIIFVNSRM